MAATFAQTTDPKLVLEIPESAPLEIPLDPMQPVAISATGDLSARTTAEFSCGTSNEECPTCPSCEDVQVSMSNADGGSFSVSPSSVAQGGNVNFNWVSRGAWDCSGSGLPGSVWETFVGDPSGPSGNISTTDVEPDSYTVGITCCNGPNCDSRTVSLTVVPSGNGNGNPPEGCEDRPPPPQMTRASSCAWGDGTNADNTVNCTSWESFFRVPFPQASSSRNFYQRPNEYLALEFNTGSYTGPNGGYIDNEAAQFGWPSTFQGGDKLMTISRCPGDFNRTQIISDSEPACYVRGDALSSVQWSTATVINSQFCALQPNTTYYLNIVFTNSPAGTAPNLLNWTCTGGGTNCGRKYQVVEF